jgi:hypothetical protein
LNRKISKERRKKKMKKVLFLTVCMVFLLAGLANATMVDLYVGPNYSIVQGIYNGNPVKWGGGSFDVSKVDGAPLSYLYCVDIGHDISVPGDYNNTDETMDGKIFGVAVNNADQVAWLLMTYASANPDEAALQAAIWHVIYPNFSINPAKVSATELADYNAYLTGVGSASVTDFLWFSPQIIGNRTEFQGVVGRLPLPEPASVLLLGLGLIGLGSIRRKFRK